RNTSTVVAGFAFCSLSASTYAARRNPLLPAPQRSGLDHFVLVTMENRSFDHFLGWLPGADGRQEGLAYTDASGASHPTFPLAPDYQGCSHPDPDHSYLGGRVEYDGGACDGWLRAGSNFAQPNLSAPAFTVPAGSFGSLC